MTNATAKQTVLLIHSGGFTSRQWRKLSEALAPQFNVLTPDLLGYGRSGAWPDGKPFHFRQDLELIETLLRDVDAPVHVGGHSYGGFLALKLALSRPELVRSIAVYEPVSFGVLDDVADADAREALSLVTREWTPGAGGADEEWLQEFVDWWNGAGAWQRLPEETRAAFRSAGWKLFQEVLSLVDDTTDQTGYARITVPTLVMGGTLSRLTERRVVEKLGAALPQGSTRFFDGAGHMGPVSHAAQVNEVMAAFFAAH
jgi:pimeloyl-ACP methyl ester carboxylesterase